MKIGKFYKTSIFQDNGARLLLISCDIFNVLLALPVINQLVIAWRYNISIMSVIILVSYYCISIILLSILALYYYYYYYYISIDIISLVL